VEPNQSNFHLEVQHLQVKAKAAAVAEIKEGQNSLFYFSSV
jgi:hypothetical protein